MTSISVFLMLMTHAYLSTITASAEGIPWRSSLLHLSKLMMSRYVFTSPHELVFNGSKIIIPQLRLDTFAGVHILFSGVIPTHPKIDHENTEIWRMARAFGATCHTDLSREITHVVTSKVKPISIASAIMSSSYL